MAETLLIRRKRAYEDPHPDDGTRILIDRLWPRGVSKERLRIDEWAKDLAPSDELRRWFGHEPERFEEFSRRYAEELAAQADKLEQLRGIAGRGRLTLVFAARDTEHCNAAALEPILRDGLPG